MIEISERDRWRHGALIRGLWLVAFCAGWAGLAPLAAAGSEHPGEPEEAAAPSHAEVEALINPSLSASRAAIASSNMVVHVHGRTVGEEEEERTAMLLHTAQQMHLRKDLEGAKKAYALLVVSKTGKQTEQTSLLALALIAQEEKAFARAQQIYSQYLARYPVDSSVPEVLLRQGLLYRQMGASTMALSKFHSVLGSALKLREGDLPYHQRLVLQAQTEIADTYYLAGQYKEALEYLGRLLKLTSEELNRQLIRYKMIRCHSALGDHEMVVADSKVFLENYPAVRETSEVRSQLARSLKELGNDQDALVQLSLLLEEQNGKSEENHSEWVYWQKRVGNSIANQLYYEEYYARALDLYQKLARLDESPEWNLPVLYQTALCYERLSQPLKAREIYAQITEKAGVAGKTSSYDTSTMVEMAAYRAGLLKWTDNLRADVDKLSLPKAGGAP